MTWISYDTHLNPRYSFYPYRNCGFPNVTSEHSIVILSAGSYFKRFQYKYDNSVIRLVIEIVYQCLMGKLVAWNIDDLYK